MKVLLERRADVGAELLRTKGKACDQELEKSGLGGTGKAVGRTDGVEKGREVSEQIIRPMDDSSRLPRGKSKAKKEATNWKKIGRMKSICKKE